MKSAPVNRSEFGLPAEELCVKMKVLRFRVHRHYTGVVISIATLKRMDHIKPLQQVQYTCLLGLAGAMKATTKQSIEINLHIRPINRQLMYETTLTALMFYRVGLSP